MLTRTSRFIRLHAEAIGHLILTAMLISILAYGYIYRFDSTYYESIRYRIHLGLTVIMILLLLMSKTRLTTRELWKNKPLFLAFLATISLSAGTWSNFGRFHGNNYYHFWELTHYYMGDKYFSELEYDGLYEAFLAAEQETTGKIHAKKVRNLRTREVVLVNSLDQELINIKKRFTPERWEEFVSDWKYFHRSMNPNRFGSMMLDHGFNPPPTWALVANVMRMGVSIFHLDVERTVKALALIDVGFYLIAFAAVFFAFGWLEMLCAIVFFSANPFGVVDYTTGAFMRQDWLAYLMIACALAKKNFYAWSGAFLGLAASSRIFPIFFAFFPFLVFAAHLVTTHKILKSHLRFGLGLVASLCVLFGFSVAFYGFSDWTVFFENILVHNRGVYTNHVSFVNGFLYEPDRSGAAYRSMQGLYYEYWRQYKEVRLVQLKLIYYVCSLTWIAAAFLSFRRSELNHQLAIGAFLPFLLSYPANYYLMFLMPILFYAFTKKYLTIFVFVCFAYLDFCRLILTGTEEFFYYVSFVVFFMSVAFILMHAFSKPIHAYTK